MHAIVTTRTAFVFFCILSAVIATACGTGGSGSGGGIQGTVQGVSCPGGETVVSIRNNAFDPSLVTVSENGVVRWNNYDGTTHSVVSTATPSNGGFSVQIGSGNFVCLKFTAPGTFAYYDILHTSMTGVVVVQ